MTEIFVNIPEGHTILCGWNSHALQIVKELEASGHPVVVVCNKRPPELQTSTMPVIEGDCSADDVLKKAGVETATSAIILAEDAGRLPADTVDARSILTALAVESLRPEIYSVLEILNPDNERHARNANVDNVVFCEQLIARFIALCASQRGISDFASDIFSHSENRSSLNTLELGAEWDGKTVGEVFAAIRAAGDLPLAIMRRGDDEAREEWTHEINPPSNTPVKLPMKVVYIKCEKK